ncbi:putative quinol monooxygenase [Paenibacillus methanolicus]|uniref:Quinol monooxygenase YgiN n=1 Tax=Paenibacillus methanolicus TaxID=582686 RepID=A0A5S5CKW8_9BACL|nr:putative quinol monooxygenase [Paenibacillus methanolicus]TYP79613.1 quinol monooxygenase YgiN [Paenibacillus methanolicus]
MIIIHAELVIDSAHREAFLEKARATVEATLREEGNLGYKLYEDADRPNTFLFVEKWASKEAIDLHGKSEYFTSFFAAASGWLQAPFKPEIFVVQAPAQ